MGNKSTPLFFGYYLHKCIVFVITAILKWRYSSLRKSDFQMGMGWEGEGIREGALIKRGRGIIEFFFGNSFHNFSCPVGYFLCSPKAKSRKKGLKWLFKIYAFVFFKRNILLSRWLMKI